MGNLAYKLGFRNGALDEQQVSAGVIKRSNKESYEEGCEMAINYNCWANDCSIVPIEILKQYCVDRAMEFE
jgi:hypothetical protein